MNLAEHIGIEEMHVDANTFSISLREGSAITVSDILLAVLKLIDQKAKEHQDANAA